MECISLVACTIYCILGSCCLCPLSFLEHNLMVNKLNMLHTCHLQMPQWLTFITQDCCGNSYCKLQISCTYVGLLIPEVSFCLCFLLQKLERLQDEELIEKPFIRKQMKIRFPQRGRSGKTVVTIKNMDFSFGDKVS